MSLDHHCMHTGCHYEAEFVIFVGDGEHRVNSCKRHFEVMLDKAAGNSGELSTTTLTADEARDVPPGAVVRRVSAWDGSPVEFG